MDPYEVLGVGRKASTSAIKKAFRKKSLETHPDRGGNADEFNRVSKAWKVLGDRERRKRYDETGTMETASESVAISVLANVFMAVTNELLKNGRRLCSEDLAMHMMDSISASMEGLFSRKKTMEQAELQLRESFNRFTAEEGLTNFMDDMVKRMAADVRKNLEMIDAQIVSFAAASDLIKKFNYKFEQMQFVWHVPTNAASSTASVVSNL